MPLKPRCFDSSGIARAPAPEPRVPFHELLKRPTLTPSENLQKMKAASEQLEKAAQKMLSSMMTREQIQEHVSKMMEHADPDDLLGTMPKDLHQYMRPVPPYPLFQYRHVCSYMETMWKYKLELSFKHPMPPKGGNLYTEKTLELRRRCWDPILRDTVDEIMFYGASDCRIHLRKALAKIRTLKESNEQYAGKMLAGVSELQVQLGRLKDAPMDPDALEAVTNAVNLHAQIEELERSKSYWMDRARKAEEQVQTEEAMAIKPTLTPEQRRAKVQFTKIMHAMLSVHYVQMALGDHVFRHLRADLECYKAKYPEDYKQAEYFLEYGMGDCKTKLKEATRAIELLEEDKQKLTQLVQGGGVDITRLLDALRRNQDLEDANRRLTEQAAYMRWKNEALLHREPDDMTAEQFVETVGVDATPNEDFLLRCKEMQPDELKRALDEEIEKLDEEFAVICEDPAKTRTLLGVLIDEARAEDARDVYERMLDLQKQRSILNCEPQNKDFVLELKHDVVANHRTIRKLRAEVHQLRSKIADTNNVDRIKARLVTAEQNVADLQRLLRQARSQDEAVPPPAPTADIKRLQVKAFNAETKVAVCETQISNLEARTKELERVNTELQEKLAEAEKKQTELACLNQIHVKQNRAAKTRIADLESQLGTHRAEGSLHTTPELTIAKIKEMQEDIDALHGENDRLRSLAAVFAALETKYRDYYLHAVQCLRKIHAGGEEVKAEAEKILRDTRMEVRILEEMYAKLKATAQTIPGLTILENAVDPVRAESEAFLQMMKDAALGKMELLAECSAMQAEIMDLDSTQASEATDAPLMAAGTMELEEDPKQQPSQDQATLKIQGFVDACLEKCPDHFIYTKDLKRMFTQFCDCAVSDRAFVQVLNELGAETKHTRAGNGVVGFKPK